MKELELKYGCNPNQKPARVFMSEGELPITVLNGRPGYINLLDALNSWQLVSELKGATGICAAASFKHVSPAGAALGIPLDDTLRAMYFTGDGELSPLGCAYARARGADRMSSFGDWIALSDECDECTASLVRHEVSDGIIAPSYSEAALEILKEKRKGGYTVVQIDPSYRPAPIERKDVFGITFEQRRNDREITDADIADIVTKNKTLIEAQRRDLLLCLITLKYTQSNSVCYACDGQIIGVGAGQQSRIHCTRLAGNKADAWQLRRHPKTLSLPFKAGVGRPERDNAIDMYVSSENEKWLSSLDWASLFDKKPDPFTEDDKREWLDKITGVSLGSDAFFPFADNIERARRSGVSAVVQPGGSIRDDLVIEACDRFNMVMAFCETRLFHH
ncbi:MAG: phosphoribosylaminoimidazolecarboxamide formyltransferase [Oscillospiraceae bacterium]